MRASTATLLVASLIFILSPVAAAAAPVMVDVRVEGASRTLFEGPVWAEPQAVKASSDSSWRSCDGTGGRDSGLAPVATPTSATAGAMSLIGQTFDGHWYPGYEDYFVTRWGPDREEDGMSWGVLVNKTLTSVGGCQYRLAEGDEVLWAYDAFEQKPLLQLYPAQDASPGAPPYVATVRPGVPFEVEVLSYEDDQEGAPAGMPSRAGSTPFAGAQVAPVLTGVQGYESIEPGTPCGADVREDCAATTDARGRATFVFAKPGWHRVKATWLVPPLAAGGQPQEAAIRSNRLDVCVSETGLDGCPAGYPEDRPRTPPPVTAEPGSGPGEGQEGEQAGGARESESSAGAGESSAGSGGETYGGHLESTVRYLQEAQNGDGGFGGAKGAPSDPDFSAWAALALAATGVNPFDQARPGGKDVFDYLAAHASELALTTDFARALLVVDAADASGEDFGGVDLVRRLLSRQLTGGADAGAFIHEGGDSSDSSAAVNDTVFAILALAPQHEQSAQAAVARANSWLVAEQDSDGGWPAACPRTTVGCSEGSEVDMTAAAVQALSAAGDRGDESEQRALAFLRGAQDADGGFPELPGRGEASNSASTAWSVQAIWASGQDPKTWLRAGGAEPLGFLASLQSADGSILWRAGEDVNPVWMTAYTLPAFAGVPLPVPPVARAQHPAPLAGAGYSVGASSASTSSRRAGVIAGGGGGGASLFSRPRPQSQGHSPGAGRLLAREPSGKSTPAGGAAANGTGPHSGAAANGGASAPAGAAGGGQGSGREVRGTLIGAAGRDPLVRGAPGLRSAAGGAGTPWAGLVVALAVLALAATGSLLESRRGELVL